jgi:glycosyltransferase involved in cell wall biosynthesis
VIVAHGKDARFLDPGRFSDPRRRRASLGIAESDTIIGFVGTPRPHKGLDLILEALERLGRPECRLMVVGVEPGDEYIQALRQRCPERSLILVPQTSLQ